MTRLLSSCSLWSDRTAYAIARSYGYLLERMCVRVYAPD